MIRYHFTIFLLVHPAEVHKIDASFIFTPPLKKSARPIRLAFYGTVATTAYWSIL